MQVQHFDFKIVVALSDNDYFSESECRAISAEPWDMKEPLELRLPVL
jgi:hypothetical protein